MAHPSESSLSYAAIMAHFDLAPYAKSRGTLALTLADRFGARLIGVAAEQMVTPVYTDLTPNISAAVTNDEVRRVEDDLLAAKRTFDAVVGARKAVEWRASAADPDRYLIEQARAADLIVVGRRATYDVRDWALGVSPGYVAMECGRPILVVPPETERLAAQKIVVAWKDTREARRAVRDAMPLLRLAREVAVVAASESFREKSAEDVAAYLALHGVNSRSAVRTGEISSVARELLDAAEDLGADLIVSGAYGHSRMREWVFGGATRDLLETANVCLLLSH